MTTYVTDGGVCWADDEVELHVAAAMAGVSPATFTHDEFPRYQVTPSQRLVLMAQGAKPTDWLEPACQHAARTGDYVRLAAFADYRGRWAIDSRRRAQQGYR